MPKYSSTSKNRLRTAHHDLQIIFEEVIRYFDCTIVEGHRTVERQQKLYASGRDEPGPILTKVDGIKIKSKHNYDPSLAIDAVPYPIDWQDHKRMYYFAGFVMATAKRLKAEGRIKNDIRWGGDWDGDTEVNDQTFMDLPHFEIA